MRKIILLGLFVAVLLSFFVGSVTTARACVQWGEPRCSTGEPVGACSGYYITPCLDGWEGVGVCSPNYYSCNDASVGYCCMYGTGTPVPVATERPTGSDCPAGTVRQETGETRCQTGGCLLPHRWGNEECQSSGQVRRFCYFAICVPSTPTCTVDVVPQTITLGAPASFPASIPASSGVITQVDFVSSNPAVAVVTTPDTTSPYSTTATGVTAGTTNITASVVMSGSVRCTDTATLTVLNTQSWWQVRDGDVMAGTGNISSVVPAGHLFNTNGLGGFPGVPIFGGSIGVAPGTISSTLWNANTLTSLTRVFKALQD